MKCEVCLGMMDELIEGALESSLAREATAHIAMCGPCSQLYANLRYEQELFRKYLLDVEPTPALWASLRLEMEKEKVIRAWQPQFRPQRWGGLNVTPQMATAVILITISLAIGIMVWRTTIDTSKHQAQNSGVDVHPSSEVKRDGTHADSDSTDRGRAANDKRKSQSAAAESGEKGSGIHVSAAGRAVRGRFGRSRVVPTVDQVVRRAEQQYLSAIEILLRDLKRRRVVISPVLFSQLQTALAEVDHNIAATRRVAHKRPRDPVAIQYLASAYENKVDLLTELTSW